MTFWKELRKLGRPAYCLAPMADVTDAPFRRLIALTAKPDVTWTEFISCEALCREGKARDLKLRDLIYSEEERPIVAQLFGSKPSQFYECAMMIKDMGYDGIDINMGCPDKNVLKQGTGASLILQPLLAQEIVRECKRGAGDLPVSVKTRIGFDTIDFTDWIHALLDVEPAALTIHGRTKKEMSLVPAHWDVIGEIANLVKSRNMDTFFIGNGDVRTLQEAKEKAALYGLDGIMLGRAIFGNPWLFDPNVVNENLTVEEKLDKIRQHVELHHEILGRSQLKNFVGLRKAFKAYIVGMPNVKQFRIKLLQSCNKEEVHELIDEYLNQLTLLQSTDEFIDISEKNNSNVI